LNSAAAINLLVGTALVESDFDYLEQTPTGPAIGFDEIELVTLNDQYATFLDYGVNAQLKLAVDDFLFPALSREDQLHGNLYYGVAIARIKYWRDERPMPAATDPLGLATYHHDIYNAGGKADIATNTPLFLKAINA
jgi:hypothetical protein